MDYMAISPAHCPTILDEEELKNRKYYACVFMQAEFFFFFNYFYLFISKIICVRNHKSPNVCGRVIPAILLTISNIGMLFDI